MDNESIVDIVLESGNGRHVVVNAERVVTTMWASRAPALYCLSLCSSLEPSWWRLGASACTRACRRMLLSTLKLRPQPSKVQTKATSIEGQTSIHCMAVGVLTFLSRMTIQVNLVVIFRIRCV